MSYYDYKELRAKATAPDATPEDVNRLGDWFFHYGTMYWNGEYYDADDGLRVVPVCEETGEDEFELVGYELR